MYIYCLCNPGFEKALKEEAAAHEPELRPSFSQPGFVTFKSETPRRVPHFTFARVTGEFLAKGTPEEAEKAASAHSGPVHRFSPAQNEGTGAEAAEGAEVLDLITVGAAVWWGRRTVARWTWGVPGGGPRLELPTEAPSRAWLKLEEMLKWSRWSPAGTVLELGSAPGGASWALLNRGVHVVGLDLAPMADLCLSHPHYSHLAKSVRDLRKKDLPPVIDALFCDLGLKPVEAVPQIRTICEWFPSIKRLYYTLKMGEGMDTAELDGWRANLSKLGFHVRSTHLPSNRTEILVVGIRD